MDYKRKYEDVLSHAKQAIDNIPDKSLAKWLQSIFPELKESEDERIRKSIIDLVEKQMPNSENKKWMIAWLEKQGEQKPEIKYIYPEFRVGDVIEPAKPNGHYAPVRVKYICNGNYYCESDDYKTFLSFPICNENEYVLTEQKPAWSEEDERMIDRLIKRRSTRLAQIPQT